MKTKHEKIVEICKKALLKQLHAVVYVQNGYPIEAVPKANILSLDKLVKTEIEQLEPEGEVLVYDAVISELDAQTVSWRGAKCILAEHYERIAENISENVSPPQQPSEGEISDIFLNNTVDYYGTAYMIFDGFKAAIKELLNR